MNIMDFLNYVEWDVQLRLRHYEFQGFDYEGTVGSFLTHGTGRLFSQAQVVAVDVKEGFMVIAYNYPSELDRY